MHMPALTGARREVSRTESRTTLYAYESMDPSRRTMPHHRGFFRSLPHIGASGGHHLAAQGADENTSVALADRSARRAARRAAQRLGRCPTGRRTAKTLDQFLLVLQHEPIDTRTAFNNSRSSLRRCSAWLVVLPCVGLRPARPPCARQRARPRNAGP